MSEAWAFRGARARPARRHVGVPRRSLLPSRVRDSVSTGRPPVRGKLRTTSRPSAASARSELASDDGRRKRHAVEEAGSVEGPRVTRVARDIPREPSPARSRDGARPSSRGRRCFRRGGGGSVQGRRGDAHAHIDGIDAELVRLLADRQRLVRQAAAFKADEREVRAPERVERVVASVRERAEKAGLAPAVAEAVWRAMIGAFIALELDEHARSRGGR
ncbi:MAG TPA: chorismate mutase [Labilithrix sp.]|nr:chorismate mutase [Labilithrix sp.]